MVSSHTNFFYANRFGVNHMSTVTYHVYKVPVLRLPILLLSLFTHHKRTLPSLSNKQFDTAFVDVMGLLLNTVCVVAVFGVFICSSQSNNEQPESLQKKSWGQSLELICKFQKTFFRIQHGVIPKCLKEGSCSCKYTLNVW